MMNREALPAPVFVATGETYCQNPIVQQHTDQTTGNPEVEVMALSPKTLMSKNKFTCQICNKSFLRAQNLQLHKRRHKNIFKTENISLFSCNKNKQAGSKNGKKVYVCPESTCLHHHRSHAIGDLAGIKKHYHRKHCEKKWKCENCSRSYAVQSDWKAHSKICWSKDYRCDCGALFSRHDKFVTHWASCDAFSPVTADNPTSGLNAAAFTGKRRLFKKITSLSLDSLSHITLPLAAVTNSNEQEHSSNNGETESYKPIPQTDLITHQTNHQDLLVDDLMKINDFTDMISFFSDNYDDCGFSYSPPEGNALFSQSESTIIQNSVTEEPSVWSRGFAASSSSSTSTIGMNSSKDDGKDDDEFVRDFLSSLMD